MAIEMKVPAVGESITEVTLAQWLKADGEYVEMDEVIAELESEKATFELNAEKSGTLKHLANAGDTLAIGTAIAAIDDTASAPADKKPKAEKAATPSPAPVVKPEPVPVSDEKPNATPLAAKILAEKGIDPKQVTGSGPQGRILKADALAASLNPVSNPQKSRNTRADKMTTLRKTVARRLVAAKNETAMLTTFNEVDMKPIMDLRARYKDKFKETHGVGLGFMSFFIKAVTIALQEFPAINSYVEGENIEYHDYCDIGIAVSAPKGLMVPVIRNAEALTMAEIESEVIRLATRARDNKISLEEMSGGTFTITNGGVFGSMLSTPILNPPQSAILGMHNIVERPVVVGGQIVIRPIMYVALSYDHRIVDGRESVSFLVKVKQGLEDPIRLLSGGKDPGALLLGI